MTWLRPAGCSVLAALFLVAVPSAGQAATFTVNSVNDGTDASPGSGCATAGLSPVCTLRAAIQEANITAESDTIVVPAGTYNLTIAGTDDTASGGDLDITNPVTINGAGAASTVVNQALPQTSPADRVFDIIGSNDPTVEIVGMQITGGRLGGIRRGNGGFSAVNSVIVTASAVVGNTRATGTGGGIEAYDGPLTLNRTTVSGNTANAGGGGISLNSGATATIFNSTISGNTANSGGGGLRAGTGDTFGTPSATFTNSTVASNTSGVGTGAGIRLETGSFAPTITLENTIVADNITGGNCFGQVASGGNNMEDAATCGLNPDSDYIGVDPQLGALADNGGGTRTHAIPSTSPAVDVVPVPECRSTVDQRNFTRPLGPACDIGAFEFAERPTTTATIPACSPSGGIPVEMTTQSGQHPTAFHYRLGSGPTQDVPTTGKTATLELPEGRHELTYWSETAEGGNGPTTTREALVDQTDPNVDIQSEQGQSLYVITRPGSVNVQATDALSGLVANAPGANQPIGTDSRGPKSYAWTAEDLCGNQATGQFDYTVLGPGLGERAVIEPLDEGVTIQLPAEGARASQKGAAFEPVTQPREIPIGTTIDARAGQARVTSSQSTTEGEIQDGAFTAGVFQVLQSRNATRGLTSLRLKGSSFTGCQAGGSASPARLSRRAIRRLRGNANGRFRTRGRHSAATVRGTDWTVIDRCDGTLTRVARGSVAVRDFRLRKTITLTEGKSYLARAEPPAPKLGKTVNVGPVRGKVFIKLPKDGKFARASQKGAGFVRLRTARSIPVRSILDTRLGTVSLRTARNRRGRLQSGRFTGGVFRVLQSRKRKTKGLTTLRLKGSASKFDRCGRGTGSSVSAKASLSRRAIRRLRARARGRYRTRGRHSAATVRGTVWTVTDRCDGTLTTVRRGTVAVRDFRRKKTVLLTRGKRYLARAPG